MEGSSTRNAPPRSRSRQPLSNRERNLPFKRRSLRSIEFEFDSAKLKDSATPVLDSVVQALIDNPDIRLVEVQGHTDERGDDAYNMDLSIRRAASVREYLESHGIAASRLISHGYGETRPLDKAHTEEAWAKNRRVEFVIQDRSR